MCTLLLRFAPDERWPLVAAAVRDEFTERAWDPPGTHWGDAWPGLLGGRDRIAGGTWLAVDPVRPALSALLNGVRLGPPADGSTRPTRGTLALQALTSGGPLEADVRHHDGFHLVLATINGVDVWSWDGQSLTPRSLPPGDHILVNGGVDAEDPLVPHFTPLLAALPAPADDATGTPAQVWGPWLELLTGAGLELDDERALIVHRLIEGKTYGSTSASLVALSAGAVRYDFTPEPTDPTSWRSVVAAGSPVADAPAPGPR